jgi:hypothetical protein
MTATYYSSTGWLSGKLRPRLAALAAAFLLAPAAAWAQAPANDNCTGAIALTVGATCTTTAATNAGATASTGVAAASCGGTGAGIDDVWYSVVVPTGGAVTVATSITAGSPMDDTVLELYTGTCGALTSIGCNDDFGGGVASSVTARSLTPGSIVYARVFGFGNATPTGAFGICATTPAAVPANDNPTGAVALTLGATCVPTNGTNEASTTTTPNGYVNPGVAPNACGIAVSPRDVWYRFTTAASGNGSSAVTIRVTGAPAGYIRLFSAASAAGPFTEVKCASGGANNTVSAPLAATGLTPNTTYYVSVAGYGSGDTQGAFTVCAVADAPLPANDAAVQAIYSVGKAPVSAPQVVQAVIRNAGSAALTNVPVTLNVAGATTFADAKIIPTLAAGASTIVTFAGYTPATIGANTLTVTLQPDGLNTNNTQTFAQSVTANTISYIDASQPLNATGIGVNTGSLVSRFSINSASTISSVSVSLAAVAASTSTYQVIILDATGAGGLPGAVLFTSPTQTRTAAAAVVTVPVTGTVSVNGPFYVGVREVTGSVQLAYQVESPIRVATHYAQLPAATTWNDVSTLFIGGAPATTRLAIDVTFGTRVLSTNSPALARSISMFPNPSQGQVTLDIRDAKAKGAMQVQVTNALGQVVHTATVRDNAENTLDLSGLATGMYVLRVQSGSEYTIRQLVLTK